MFECSKCYTVLIDELMEDEHERIYCLECYADHQQDLEYQEAIKEEVRRDFELYKQTGIKPNYAPPSNRWDEDIELGAINPAKE